MSGKQHSRIGVSLAIALILAYYVKLGGHLNVTDTITILLSSVIGSLIVDIDSKRSKASQALAKVMTVIFWSILILSIADRYLVSGISSNTLDYLVNVLLSIDNRFGLFILCILITLGKLSPHRGFTHKVLGTSLFIIVSFLTFGKIFSIGFIIGYISHILADKTTPEGLKFFELRFPLQDKKGKFNINF